MRAKKRVMRPDTYRFEGPEKKLEIILFAPGNALRSRHNERWERVAAASGSQIVSRKITAHIDAYVLSESSLFVWDDRILMITCGRTRLIDAIPSIMEIIDRKAVAFVFYERKNFIFPRDQPSDFESDVAYISEFFPGKSYRLGPANLDHVHVFYSSHASAPNARDVTLQILMHDLAPAVITAFSSQKTTQAVQQRQIAGLMRLYPQMLTDSHIFSPFGFSLNGILGRCYLTIHITPQANGSYASFETNIIEENYTNVIEAVLSAFQPGKFSLALTTSTDEHTIPLHAGVGNVSRAFRATEKSLYEFDSGYAVSFRNYIQN